MEPTSLCFVDTYFLAVWCVFMQIHVYPKSRYHSQSCYSQYCWLQSLHSLFTIYCFFLVIVDNAVTDTPDTLIVLAFCYMLLFANSTVNAVIIEQ